MSQVNNQNLANVEVKTKQTRRADATVLPIRIRQRTKSKLELLLRQTNKDRPSRKVKADDLISFSLQLLTEQHLDEICDKMLSNRDRMEILFQHFLKGRRGATREDFLGELIKGRLSQ